MEFLVRTDIELPNDVPPAAREDLIAKEIVRGRQLLAEGTIRRIWRVPGSWAAIALYEVDSINDLHNAVASLPLWRWMRVTVTPLAVHTLELDSAGDPAELASRWT